MYSVITVGHLRLILDDLPDDFQVYPTVVCNLGILDGIDQPHGYIDLQDKTIKGVPEDE